jgi:hypothetical protein
MNDTTDTTATPRYRIAITAVGKHFMAADNALRGAYQCGLPLAIVMRRAGRVGDSRTAWSYPLGVAQETAAGLNERFVSNGGIGQPFRVEEAP